MKQKQQLFIFVSLRPTAWVVGSFMILGPGMNSKKVDSPDWLLSGILL